MRKVAGIASYVANTGFSTMAGYAHTMVSTVAQNLTGTPSIVVDNVNGLGIVTFPSQGKMRFDFDATGDLPLLQVGEVCLHGQTILRLHMFPVVTTMGGYNGWRQILHQDMSGNYFTVGVVTASKFAW